MPTIYFAGQDNFGNRGCEALIRSSVKTIRQEFPNAKFLVPSHNIQNDAKQWPQAGIQGVEFVAAEPFPGKMRWWGRLRRLIKYFESFPPNYELTSQTKRAIERSDVVLMTGGDIISLDYGIESLFYWSRICDVARKMGKPLVLWAASVGPFKQNPSAELRMVDFLKSHQLITVRETSSLEYLAELGIERVRLVADVAFVLEPELPPADFLPAICQAEVPIFGFNVSPVIRRFRNDPRGKSALDAEIAAFLIQTLREERLNVLLIPHVDPLNGASNNSDSDYMLSILNAVRNAGFGEDRISMLPRTLNTAQLKGAIGRCRYFFGARTHATVASLSQCVPTISIAYSVKAKGINKDLFGHLRYVLETPDVNQKTLTEHLKKLINEREHIVQTLQSRIPELMQNAQLSAKALKALLISR